MATVNEQIVIGRKFRKLIDESAKLWQRISFWTKASDVEFNDGKTAEAKLGSIDGITDSLVSTSSRIAASAKAINILNNNLNSHPQFIYDADGKITGYKTKAGADTVFPFNSPHLDIQTGSGTSKKPATITFTGIQKSEIHIVVTSDRFNRPTFQLTGDLQSYEELSHTISQYMVCSVFKVTMAKTGGSLMVTKEYYAPNQNTVFDLVGVLF